MNCFVLYSQFVVSALNYDSHVINAIYMDSTPLLRNTFKALLTLYEPWNLDFGTHLLPDFCVSPSIKNIHIFLLRYIPAMYYLLLIVLTYFSLKLNNFQCQVMEVRRCLHPVRSCIGSIRALINPQASIVDVIATLFILSSAKFFVNSLLAFRATFLTNITAQPPVVLNKVLYTDVTCPYLSTHHIIYMTIAALTLSFQAAILLLLTCYPFRLFRRALAFIVRSNTKLQYLNMLVEKVQGHYKDGTNGTRDLRIFSAFYLMIMVVILLSSQMIRVGRSLEYMVKGLLLFISSITVLVVRPYKAEHLSAYDGMLLALLGMQCILIYLKRRFLNTYLLWLLAVTMALPQLALIAYTLKVVAKFIVRKCRKKRNQDVEIMDNHFVSSPEQNTGYHKRDDENKEGAGLTEKTPLLL